MELKDKVEFVDLDRFGSWILNKSQITTTVIHVF